MSGVTLPISQPCGTASPGRLALLLPRAPRWDVVHLALAAGHGAHAQGMAPFAAPPCAPLGGVLALLGFFPWTEKKPRAVGCSQLSLIRGIFTGASKIDSHSHRFMGLHGSLCRECGTTLWLGTLFSYPTQP